MMETPWPNSFVGIIPLSVMPIALRTPSSLSMLSQTTSTTWRAMETPITDGRMYEISTRVTDLLCSVFISKYESELYDQHQNTSLRIGMVIQNDMSTPQWMSCLILVMFVFCSVQQPLRHLVASHLSKHSLDKSQTSAS